MGNTSNKIEDVNEVFEALQAWINQKPGLDHNNYGHGAEGGRLYRDELRSITRDKKRAQKALDEARSVQPLNIARKIDRSECICNEDMPYCTCHDDSCWDKLTHRDGSHTYTYANGCSSCGCKWADEPATRETLLADAFRAFSGRLQWVPRVYGKIVAWSDVRTPGKAEPIKEFVPGKLEYTTGQYWPTEYRKAAASVLESYIASVRQAIAAENKPSFVYRTVEDVISANRSIGNHFFDKDTMSFFKSKVESGLIDGKRFIMSEKGPDEVRRFTIREASPTGEIDTIGEFQQFATLAQARGAVHTDDETLKAMAKAGK